MTKTGWAIVVDGTDEGLCYIDGALPNSSVWQIYTNPRDAKRWLKIKFFNAKYKIVKVNING